MLPESELSERANAGFLSVRKRQDRADTCEASLRCVAPCVSAAPPSGWRPFHSESIYTASHLKHTKTHAQTEYSSPLKYKNGLCVFTCVNAYMSHKLTGFLKRLPAVVANVLESSPINVLVVPWTCYNRPKNEVRINYEQQSWTETVHPVHLNSFTHTKVIWF